MSTSLLVALVFAGAAAPVCPPQLPLAAEITPELAQEVAAVEHPLQASARAKRARQAGTADGLPTELYAVVKVVDGDTLHVQRGEAVEKLRFLSVDTEEKIRGKAKLTGTKPDTVFGTETSAWAERFFAALADEDGVTRVGLAFPDGVEAYDVYGRLLCHVILADGRDFNLELVIQGWSPYFNKYGNSRICHAEFVAAQDFARETAIGIWDPATNVPATPGAPSAVRPYDRLLPWWNARAQAVDAYRAARAEHPERCAAADAPEELAQAAEYAAAHPDAATRVFGSIDRVFEERDGAKTFLFRTGKGLPALRVRVDAEHLASLDALDLAGSTEEFRQNYLWVTGRLTAGTTDRGGYEVVVTKPEQIRRAGPEPASPQPDDSGDSEE